MRITLLLTCFFWTAFAVAQSPKLKITPLTGNYFIYTTYGTYENNPVPAHGMYVVTDRGVVLLDTPWDTTQFQPLLDSISVRHRKKVVICIATHWHSDRTAGLEYYRRKKIKTYSTMLTDSFSQRNNHKRAEFLMARDTVFNVSGTSFEVHYPGGGHTEDNIVVWFGKEKILYGGCLIKGAEAENLGYLGDANIALYEETLRELERRYPDPAYIIISHHDWTNVNSLKNSIRLAGQLNKSVSVPAGKQVVRIARIKVDSASLEKYVEALKEQMSTAIRLEPGVLSYHAVAQKDDPANITILEVYADQAAYQLHINTPHFKRYKETVKDMVKSLVLEDLTSIGIYSK
jgi:metallo-beta-lactamase class B